MTDQLATPAPASHDPRVPTGVLEESAASLFEAMISARDSEERGEPGAPTAFYRALVSATLLLPVPPGTQDQAHESLTAAVTDQEEVEIGVMLARDGEGNPVSVVFGSGAALAAWSPAGTGSIALPGRIVVRNLAASGLPAIIDPAGPIPYRFDPHELQTLAAGFVPGSEERLFAEERAASIRLRLPTTDTRALETELADVLRAADVSEAYLVDSAGSGTWRLTLGLLLEPNVDGHAVLAAVQERVAADELDVVLLDGPMLAQLRGLTEPLHTGTRRGRR